MNKHNINTSSSDYDLLNSLNKFMLTQATISNFSKIVHKKNVEIEKKQIQSLDSVFFSR